MGESRMNVFFSTPRQVYRYLTAGIGEEYIWGEKQIAVKDRGVVYKVAEKTIYNHADDSNGKQLLQQRRKGGFALRTVDKYAKAHLSKVVDAAGDDEQVEPDRAPGAAERRIEADADLKAIEARRKKIKLQEELGLLVPMGTIESELGERAQAFKLHQASFMRDVSAEVVSIFGGDFQVAMEIIALVGGDEDKAEALSGYMFSKSSTLLALYKRRLTESLNAYAIGEWFTEDMREAWVKYMASIEAEQETAIRALVEKAGGDTNRVAQLLPMFDVRIREVE